MLIYHTDDPYMISGRVIFNNHMSPKTAYNMFVPANDNIETTSLHEFGHFLGMFHEQDMLGSSLFCTLNRAYMKNPIDPGKAFP